MGARVTAVNNVGRTAGQLGAFVGMFQNRCHHMLLSRDLHNIHDCIIFIESCDLCINYFVWVNVHICDVCVFMNVYK